MISKLTLEGYRSFESYSLADLRRVNLLVGPNNSGKTSILEAVDFLASRGDPRVLIQPALRRGERQVSSSHDAPNQDRRSDPYDISHQFFGHRFDVGSRFRVSSNDDLGQIIVTIEPAEDEESADLFDLDEEPTPTLGLRIERGEHRTINLAVNDDGSILWNVRAFRMAPKNGSSHTRPVRFVTVDSLDSGIMASMWDKIIVDGRESEVIHAMRILAEGLSSIHFLSQAGLPRQRSSGIVLGFETGRRRVPLGSHGDGIRRLLALALSLSQLHRGLLLADEIDTGFHWTVMEDMWRLVVETARESSIQVFATTHSYDCVMGLASLLESQPGLSEEVSIQKIERSLPQAVAFDADDIRVAARQNLELR